MLNSVESVKQRYNVTLHFDVVKDIGRFLLPFVSHGLEGTTLTIADEFFWLPSLLIEISALLSSAWA